VNAPPTLAVTGSTGALGGLVAHSLADAGVGQRLLARDPTRAPELPAGVPVAMSYGDRLAAVRALAGATVLFMVSGAESADRLEQHRTFVDAAVDAGVEHIVYTSFYGAAADCTFTLGRDHWATEEHIKSAGLSYTFLRDNFYLDVLPLFAGRDGVLRGPAGEGRVSAVARADIARVAVAVLRDPAAHHHATYHLTGPEALTMTEVAHTITAVTGRPVTFHDETIDEAYESRRQWPAPQWQYDAWVSTYLAIARGEVAGITGDVAAVTGHAPMSLADLLVAGSG
jgi:NAD(P)H dehydrogenase (quinone)